MKYILFLGNCNTNFIYNAIFPKVYISKKKQNKKQIDINTSSLKLCSEID